MEVVLVDKRGGAREGAGRPKGAKNLAQVNFKKNLREYISPTEVKFLVERLKRWAKSDKKIAMFLAEQIFGKAKSNEIPGEKTNNIAIFLDNLEKPKLKEPDYIFDGSPITGQIMESITSLPDQGQGTEEDTIHSE